jgi:hypothetical protein
MFDNFFFFECVPFPLYPSLFPMALKKLSFLLKLVSSGRTGLWIPTLYISSESTLFSLDYGKPLGFLMGLLSGEEL